MTIRGKDLSTMRRTTRTGRAAVAALAVAATGAASLVGVLATPAQAAVVNSATARVAAAPVAAAPVPASVYGSTNSLSCSTAAGCDLFAVGGYFTVTPVGGTAKQVKTWRFATATSSGADLTTGSMPVILADQGETITIHLHNDLPVNVPISLTAPGLRAGTNANDTNGVAKAATKDYSFTASKAGTFLYEAGHTTNGPRAVAMGLVGAIVVRPADFTTKQTDLGGSAVPDSTFDDEQVMVLTDVDPAFAADQYATLPPNTLFDLRKFHSTYRLINGVAYPNVPSITTTAGNKVLLRYLNAGVLGKAMGPVGARQQVVAIDGYASSAGALAADSLPPGQTEDVIITAAAGKTLVVDQSGGLDNGGAVIPGETSSATKRRVDLGGLIQVIDATAVNATSDTTGPVLTLGATTGTGAGPFTIPVSAVDQASAPCATAGACGPSGVAAIQYTVDGGAAVTVAGATSTAGDAATGTISLASLGNGTHTVSVRAQDGAATPNWGAPVVTQIVVSTSGPDTKAAVVAPAAVSTVNAVTLALSATGDATVNGGGSVTDMEYFAAAGTTAPAGAGGSGTAMALTPGPVVAGTATISMGAGSAEGTWTVWVRSKGFNGFWGPFTSATFVVDNTAPTGVTGGAVSPNPTDGLVGDPVEPTSLKVQASFSDTGTVTTPIVAAEGFLGGTTAATAGTQPVITNGTGFVFVANDGTFDGASTSTTPPSTTSELAYGLVPLTQLTAYATDGTYNVWVHGKDKAGNWGPLVAIPFTINRKPVVSSVTVTQNNLTSYTLTVTGRNAVVTSAAVTFPATPTATLAQACTGAFGPDPISLTCTVSPTAAQVAAAVSGGNLTFAVTLTSAKGTSAPGTATLPNVLTGLSALTKTVTTPAGTPLTYTMPPFGSPAVLSYLGAFTFAPGSLVTGNSNNGYVTIASLRNGNAGVVTVQYRRSSAAATTGTLRLTLNGANVGTYTGLTVAGTHKINLVFSSGSRLTLSVDNTVRIQSQTNAVAAGSRLTSAQFGNLGTVGAVNLAGSATISAYSANRFTTP